MQLKFTLFVFITSFYFNSCTIKVFGQNKIDTDVIQLAKLINDNFQFSDELLSKRINELIIVELKIKNNQIDTYQVWYNESSLSVYQTKIMLNKILHHWKPISKLPPTVLIPIVLYFDNDDQIENSTWDIDQAILPNKEVLKGNVLITRRVILVHTLPRK